MENIKEWTSLPMPELLARASCRKDWKRIPAESSLLPPLPPPNNPISQGTELNCVGLKTVVISVVQAVTELVG